MTYKIRYDVEGKLNLGEIKMLFENDKWYRRSVVSFKKMIDKNGEQYFYNSLKEVKENVSLLFDDTRCDNLFNKQFENYFDLGFSLKELSKGIYAHLKYEGNPDLKYVYSKKKLNGYDIIVYVVIRNKQIKDK